MTLDNAMQHLYHFCARLSSGTYVDARPEFDFTSLDGQISAKASLPISVDLIFYSGSLTCTTKKKSSGQWNTESRAPGDDHGQFYRHIIIHVLLHRGLCLLQYSKLPLWAISAYVDLGWNAIRTPNVFYAFNDH